MLSTIGIAIVFGFFGGFILMVFNSQRDTVDPRGNFFWGFVITFLVTLIFLK